METSENVQVDGGKTGLLSKREQRQGIKANQE